MEHLKKGFLSQVIVFAIQRHDNIWHDNYWISSNIWNSALGLQHINIFINSSAKFYTQVLYRGKRTFNKCHRLLVSAVQRRSCINKSFILFSLAWPCNISHAFDFLTFLCIGVTYKSFLELSREPKLMKAVSVKAILSNYLIAMLLDSQSIWRFWKASHPGDMIIVPTWSIQLGYLPIVDDRVGMQSLLEGFTAFQCLCTFSEGAHQYFFGVKMNNREHCRPLLPKVNTQTQVSDSPQHAFMARTFR